MTSDTATNGNGHCVNTGGVKESVNDSRMTGDGYARDTQLARLRGARDVDVINFVIDSV